MPRTTRNDAARYRATPSLALERARRGLSQIEFGEATGMGQSGISKLEGGKRIIRIRVAHNVASALGLTVEQLLRRRLLEIARDDDGQRGEATG